MKKRVLSGIRASGRLHLGNYLGAVKGMLELQNNPEYETFYMVADLHALTTPHDIDELRKNRREVVIDYLAAGLDPEKSVIFQQADSLHAELAFYLSSVVTVARLQHLPTYKEKVKQYPEHSTMALLNYPVLMSADILAYKAHAVPVGDDQIPHLEVAREIARKMNEQYGMDFPEPEQFKTTGHYVPSLTGQGKMSKSVEGSFITLTDTIETIKKRLAGVATDSGKGYIEKGLYIDQQFSRHETDAVSYSDGVSVLMDFVTLFQGNHRKEEYDTLYTSTGIRYSDLKNELADAIYKELEPLQEKRRELEEKIEYVDEVIHEGGKKARAVVEETILEVREKMGLK